MRIYRMGFVLRDSYQTPARVIILLRSGHDLELQYSKRDNNGDCVGKPFEMTYLLGDNQASLLDRFEMRTPESYAAWRKVLLAVFEHDMLTPIKPQGAVIGAVEPFKARLMELHEVAAFGQPMWPFEEAVPITDVSILQIMRAFVRAPREVRNNVNL